jgi:hypothetical protein
MLKVGGRVIVFIFGHNVMIIFLTLNTYTSWLQVTQQQCSIKAMTIKLGVHGSQKAN